MERTLYYKLHGPGSSISSNKLARFFHILNFKCDEEKKVQCKMVNFSISVTWKPFHSSSIWRHEDIRMI